MPDIVVTTYDWVPPPPRGYVRDIRLCWALEEAGLPYRVATTPFRGRGPQHLAHQPFNQVPWLTHDDVSIFESGAILLYLGGLSEKLMPKDADKRLAVTQWLFAAQASVEAASQPWSFFHFMGKAGDGPMWAFFDNFMQHRLKHLEIVLTDREWLVDRFTVADILMADILRLADRFDGLAQYPACRTYMRRATSRPAFVKAHAEQLARFAKTV